MAVSERTTPAPAHLEQLVPDESAPSGLLLLPDEVSPVGEEVVAGFRPDAQELRVTALERGLAVEVALPPGTRAGHYSEHAADWVLPLIGIPPTVVATLIATHLQRRLDAWRRGGGTRTPSVRYREVERHGEELKIREIEGPVDEVLDWLGEHRGGKPELPSGDDGD